MLKHLPGTKYTVNYTVVLCTIFPTLLQPHAMSADPAIGGAAGP